MIENIKEFIRDWWYQIADLIQDNTFGAACAFIAVPVLLIIGIMVTLISLFANPLIFLTIIAIIVGLVLILKNVDLDNYN